MTSTLRITLAALLTSSSIALAQSAHLKSPEVSTDNKATFRLKAELFDTPQKPNHTSK